MPRLSDRAILVTGAAGAIGAAICHAILDAGGFVIGCDLQDGEHVEHVFDVTRERDWQATIGRIAASGHSLAGLVNAACR
jgi:nucleoside-diphosphate-sugar epimerase